MGSKESHFISKISGLEKKLSSFFEVKEVSLLGGGLSNRCLKITDTNNKHYVWRPNDVAVNQFGLNRQNEYQVLRLAFLHGLTSPPLFYSLDGLLTTWVEGKQLKEISLSDLAKLLADVHQLPLLGNAFDPYQKGQFYFNRLKKVKNHPLIKKAHQTCQALKKVDLLSPVTIHCDLAYYNIIQTPNSQFQLIDWEYAAAGSPALDLVFSALANQFILEDLVEQYCEQRKIAQKHIWLQECFGWVPMNYYLAGLWYALGYELYETPFYWQQALINLEKV